MRKETKSIALQNKILVMFTNGGEQWFGFSTIRGESCDVLLFDKN